MTEKNKKKLLMLLIEWLDEGYTQGDTVTSLRQDQPLFANVVQVVINELEREI